MTTRTRAANAAALSLDTPADAFDRRTILASAGAAAVLAAIGTPATASQAADPDAPLWVLRPRWLATLAAFHVAMKQTDFALNAAYALPGWASASAVDRASLKSLAGATEAEARQDEASAANTAVVDEIAAVRARTLAGLGFKVEVSRDWEHDREPLTASIMADVAAFAAAHPALRI